MKPIRRPDLPAVSPNASLPGQWARALAAAGIVAGLYGSLGGSALLFLLIFIGLVMLGGLLLQVLGPRKIELVRTLSPVQPTAGNGVLVTVNLSFRCRLPIPWLMIEERWTCGNHRLLLFPGFRREFQYTYRLERLSRGRQQLRYCRVSWGDLPGWFTGTSAPEVSQAFKVLPSPLYLGKRPSEEGAGKVLTQVPSRRRTGPEEVSDIRNYQPGDPMNRVHWKNTARSGFLQSRVPEREKGRMLCVVLDNCPSSYEIPWESLPPRGHSSYGEPAFERAVSAALGLLLTAERAGSYAQLFTGGWPEGMARYEGLGVIPGRVLDTLAEIAPDGTRTLARLLEDASRQWIPGMNVAVITGCPDREAALTISRLLAQGIKVDLYYVWDREAPGKRNPTPGPAAGHRRPSAEAGALVPHSAPVLSDKITVVYEAGQGGFSASADVVSNLSGKESVGSGTAPTICGSLGRLGAGLYCLEHVPPAGERGEGRADGEVRKPSAR
ncbi:DUF58 domain-containing protein [Paenibacillus sp. URB8-2]|uniref:DUF58 domain-containing protein n=1 Tax=Paenibacillus sp. URB8-2 TaxID=2741301 RepID=UPI0015C19A09|nr:DUF58 domain-containing protein [Paenibacillus sp. URB8-2]BCG57251.1 hypothetical protein PUR_06760 [Paenibacillus sp. URB8-2]